MATQELVSGLAGQHKEPRSRTALIRDPLTRAAAIMTLWLYAATLTIYTLSLLFRDRLTLQTFFGEESCPA